MEKNIKLKLPFKIFLTLALLVRGFFKEAFVVFVSIFAFFIIFALVGCSKPKDQLNIIRTSDGRTFTQVTLLTDWYAQPEHGGYYQALALGYYEDAGLEVKIIPGGLRCGNYERVALNDVQFSIGRSDDALVRASREVPIAIVGVEMQHDPTGIMFHSSNRISTLKDLDSKNLKAGIGMIWPHQLMHDLNISFKIVPIGNGFAHFIDDPLLFQQCYVTNEPYFLKKSGVDVETLLVYPYGPDPYRVIFTSQKLAHTHPEVIKAFVQASYRGWQSFLENPEPAFNLIRQANASMDDEAFLHYAFTQLKKYNFVTGNSEHEEFLGKLDLARIKKEIDNLREINALDEAPKLDQVLDMRFFENAKDTVTVPISTLPSSISN